MSHFLQILKANKLERLCKDYEKQRNISIKQRDNPPKITNLQKFLQICRKNKRQSNKSPRCRRWRKSLVNYFSTPGSLQNVLGKSFLGAISGFLLTYLLFFILVVQLNNELTKASVLCIITGSVLVMGLAFSTTVRCTVLLILPQLFSKRGRQALVAYAFLLAMTGPIKNVLDNLGIMSETIACTQEQLKEALRQIRDLIKQPLAIVKKALKSVVTYAKEIIKKLKEIMLSIKRVIKSILDVFKSAFKWLTGIANICNKKMGTPFERCMQVMTQSVSDCNAQLGPAFGWVCSVTYVGSFICALVKLWSYICVLLDFINDSFIVDVVKKVKTFVRHVKLMFYVKIRFSHKYHFETRQSKNLREIIRGIIREINDRTHAFVSAFHAISGATFLLFFILIVKTIRYRYKFLTNDRFDNFYITNDLIDMDLRRSDMSKEVIFPLNARENNTYVRLQSCKLLRHERTKLLKTAISLIMVSLQLSIYMMVDVSLHWLLSLIRYHGAYQDPIELPQLPSVHVTGNNVLAQLFKSIVKAFDPERDGAMKLDMLACLPDPIPPDYNRYVKIATTLILCWVLTLLEPYGLRFRHLILCKYYPERARERAIWLYNRILKGRVNFFKFARRHLTKNDEAKKFSCVQFLLAHTRNKFLVKCLETAAPKMRACVICGEEDASSTVGKRMKKSRDGKADQKFYECSNYQCSAIYCSKCYNDQNNVCFLCGLPLTYEDLSDISEERDSSEEENWEENTSESSKKNESADEDSDSLTSTSVTSIRSISHSTNSDTDSKSLKSSSFVSLQSVQVDSQTVLSSTSSSKDQLEAVRSLQDSSSFVNASEIILLNEIDGSESSLTVQNERTNDVWNGTDTSCSSLTCVNAHGRRK